MLVMQLDALRRAIEYRRKQILRQRRDILELQRAGIPTKSAEELLERMLLKVDELCAERTRLWAAERQVNPERRGTQRRGL
jgi:hypothetical protein